MKLDLLRTTLAAGLVVLLVAPAVLAQISGGSAAVQYAKGETWSVCSAPNEIWSPLTPFIQAARAANIIALAAVPPGTRNR